ncbi:hypothetical protein LEM8419_00278 [Neolewinella maritima]|uniref:Capsule biosynthesis protein n=1 Tax=Neolewinella maritima TaxID=1383882 RepID=A0ABM9AXK5_9BACT|nr:hypothetical protein [Neolewinella maritima]CAH0998983.1 hypothetical protein LEM8419_00278 [Neolewinella maritima]
MNLLFNGFGTAAVTGLVESFVSAPDGGTVYWIRDNLGEEQQVSRDGLLVLDHQEVLQLNPDVVPPVQQEVSWSDELLQCYARIKPVVLKMQDRLDRYGPAVSYAQRETTLRKHFNYWLRFLTQRKIEGFICSNVPHETVDYIVYELCQALGIRTVFFYQWTPDVLLPLRRIAQLGEQSTRPVSILGEADVQLLIATEIRIQKQYETGRERTPFYMQTGIVRRQKQRRERHWIRRALTKVRTDWRRMVSPSGLRYAWYLLAEKRFLQVRADRTFAERYAAIATDTPDLDQPYIYLALHYQPEATTSPLGGVFVDQYLMVDALLAAFPEQVQVYVKEHPAQGLVGRGEGYCELFAASPRLHFIASGVSSLRLRQHAVAVATVTGTVGYESIWLGIPVLAFGLTYYLGGPGVYSVTSVDTARRAATEIMQRSPSKPEGQGRAFTAALLARTLPANCDAYYHENSVLGLAVAHNVRVIGDEIRAQLTAPAPPPL